MHTSDGCVAIIIDLEINSIGLNLPSDHKNDVHDTFVSNGSQVSAANNYPIETVFGFIQVNAHIDITRRGVIIANKA